uniref:Uncharacterized protein n=1 Tax=Arundo donax TaxID=35708 RepID=A0A0A8ZJ16_ARUDO
MWFSDASGSPPLLCAGFTPLVFTIVSELNGRSPNDTRRLDPAACVPAPPLACLLVSIYVTAASCVHDSPQCTARVRAGSHRGKAYVSLLARRREIVGVRGKEWKGREGTTWGS